MLRRKEGNHKSALARALLLTTLGTQDWCVNKSDDDCFELRLLNWDLLSNTCEIE
jgi:hypothetical protein